MKHYVIDADGGIREFSKEAGSKIAAGLQGIPDFAASKQRYLQVKVVPNESQEKLEVHLASAWLEFDQQGSLINVLPDNAENKEPDDFLRQTCAELALADEAQLPLVWH